jgi:valyl-tRNA synthetase
MKLYSKLRNDFEVYAWRSCYGTYEFIWGDFCDWYIELVIKSRLQQDAEPNLRRQDSKLLLFVLKVLEAVASFMPHITGGNLAL